jgi:hypothetical protein
MTLPDERRRAVQRARELLYNLTVASKTPGVPPTVRQEALSILRHFPSDLYLPVAEMFEAAYAPPQVADKVAP